MPIVTVSIRNVSYPIVCDNGQEELLQDLAKKVDERVKALGESQGKGSDIRLLLMAALMMESELSDLQAGNSPSSSTPKPAENRPSIDPALQKELDNLVNHLENIASELDQV